MAKKKKKSIGEGLLAGMEEALEMETVLTAEKAGLEKLTSMDVSLVDAIDVNIELSESDKETSINRIEDQTKDIEITSELTDDKFEKELRKFIIPKIRSASYRWKYRSEAIKQARVSRGLYRCAICNRTDLKNGEFAVDHVIPVVSLDGWDGNLDVYIRRMLVKTNGWQILCKSPCHELKTQTEVQIRKFRRQNKK